ncbi:MAG: M20/M25/M40 family metallo-hydrolase, partial [Caldisericota bacterium]|nr:M20/M25/M40 family metallo-hydrolase [Caldisericota bacterium]
NGGVEKTVQRCIIRDHDKDKFEKRKKFIKECTHFINKKYGKGTVELQLKDTYCNMKEVIAKNPQLINIAQKAIKDAGISPIVKPIRGGTDGAQFSFMGLPTPNLFSGGHNFHGIYEYIPIFAMEKAVEVIVNIVKEFGKIE